MIFFKKNPFGYYFGEIWLDFLNMLEKKRFRGYISVSVVGAPGCATRTTSGRC